MLEEENGPRFHHPIRDEMNDLPMSDLLPGIIGEVKCHKGKLVQTPFPYILPC